MNANQINGEIAHSLGWRCTWLANGKVASSAGTVQADCSQCFDHCGDPLDQGLAGAGTVLQSDWRGIRLSWACPGCGVKVTEQTTLVGSGAHASEIAKDPVCHRCKKA
jgi:hypothetical protein